MNKELKRLEDHPQKGCDRITLNARQAAVLVILYQGRRGDLRTVLTVRAGHLTHHPGEVALPGGRCEPQDASLVFTAFREAEEEVGICAKSLHLLTILPPILSRSSNFIVTPVVAWINKAPTRFKPAPTEVARVFTVPIRKFINKSPSYSFMHLEDEYPLHCVRHYTFRVMGLTCNILVHTASIAFDVQPEFPFKYPMYEEMEGEEAIEIIE